MLDAMSLEESLTFWSTQMERCLRCYACRNTSHVRADFSIRQPRLALGGPLHWLRRVPAFLPRTSSPRSRAAISRKPSLSNMPASYSCRWMTSTVGPSKVFASRPLSNSPLTQPAKNYPQPLEQASRYLTPRLPTPPASPETAPSAFPRPPNSANAHSSPGSR